MRNGTVYAVVPREQDLSRPMVQLELTAPWPVWRMIIEQLEFRHIYDYVTQGMGGRMCWGHGTQTPDAPPDARTMLIWMPLGKLENLSDTWEWKTMREMVEHPARHWKQMSSWMRMMRRVRARIAERRAKQNGDGE